MPHPDFAHYPVVPLLVLGLVVGFVSGMFGVGGGFLLTPLLNVALGIPYPIAVGSGLCQMIGTATSAYLRHQHLQQGEARVDWLMLGGSLIGVQAGAEVLAYLSQLQQWSINGRQIPAAKLVLGPGYVVILLIAAAFMVSESIRRRHLGGAPESVRPGPLARVRIPPYVDLPRAGLCRVSAPVLAYLGLGLGFLSGLLGIGGGVALMPVLIYGFGFQIRQAAGTGILLLIATSIVGTIIHALAGHVSLGIVLPLMFSSSLAAQFGALTTKRLPPASLRLAFAGVILLTVAALLFDLARSLFG